MQKIIYNQSPVDLEKYFTLAEKSGENLVLPICDSVEDFKSLKFAVYSPIAADFFIKTSYDFLSEQTGLDIETVNKLISKSLSGRFVMSALRNKPTINFEDILRDLMIESYGKYDGHRGLFFNTQVNLAKSQGLDRNEYVFLQKYDEEVGEEGYDMKGFPLHYTRYGGTWYWHPTNGRWECSIILAGSVIDRMASALNQSSKDFTDEVYRLINPQIKNVSDICTSYSYREFCSALKKSIKFDNIKTKQSATVGEIVMPALGEYLLKFRENYPDIERSYDESLKNCLNSIENGKLKLEDCFAVMDSEHIFALSSDKQVAKDIKDYTNSKEAKIVGAKKLIELLMQADQAQRT